MNFGNPTSSVFHTQLSFLLMAMRSSSSSFSYRFTYDVFLSFRGTDTRYGFSGNLYKALCDKGIHTFFDQYELENGKEITPSLVKAIEESRIAIPVFSKKFAYSSFCLDELVHIMECVNSKGRLVLPIFYDTDPSHVRYQKGKYGEALARHEARFTNDNMNMERFHKWKMALNQAANLCGYHFKQGDGYEHVFIGKIVEDVLRKIKRVALPIADYPVGLESQVLQVNSLLDVGSDDGVHMVGIHGIGGIGKTTLVLAVYNSIADHFDGLCFLGNVRENSSKHGLMHLQKILLSEILGENNIEFASVEQGSAILQQRLQRKKVLLILDDVDNQEQLKAFVRRPAWFGPGSRVIITTRDKHLLACHEIKRTYEVKQLNKNDALQLLRWKAFKMEEPNPSYKNAMNSVVAYASGLPLALGVIGSNLYGKSPKEWESSINQYGRIPNNQILKILKLSFDALEEDEKSVFLDIACCFKGYALEELEAILCAHHGDRVTHQITVLVEKSLIKINCDGKLTLHDLIEDMGKEIIRQESPKEPGKRSRLWCPQDIVQVLEEDVKLANLKVLKFDYCKYLTQVDDVSSLSNLEELSVSGCENLITIHSSVGLLDKLKTLNAFGCSKIRCFPSFKLTSLEQLDIQFCRNLESFPEILEKMENMTKLDLMCTSIQELPVSFRNLTRLRKLRLWRNGRFRLPSCIIMMPELTTIDVYKCKPWLLPKLNEGEKKESSTASSNVECLILEKCNFSEKCFESHLRWFANVQELNLSSSNFTILPECIKEYRFLKNLILNDCLNLQEIRGLPPNLKYFSARNCVSLTYSIRRMLLNQELHEAKSMRFVLPGARIPNWFEEQRKKHSQISFWFRNKFPSIIFCLLVQLEISASPLNFSLSINDKKDIYEFRDILKQLLLRIGHIWLLDWTDDQDFQARLEKAVLKNEWNYVNIAVEQPDILKNIGIHVIKQKSSMKDIRFTNPYRGN